MRLIFGADHAGFHLRQALAAWARGQGHEVKEVGATTEEAYDYPAASDEVVKGILTGAFDLGVVACGTGIGVCIRANRHKGIRAANCCNPEMARLARQHNHANVLCVGGRLLSESEGIAILQAFIETPESAEDRHRRRVEMLDGNIEA
ncbi:MAG: RpiB/LacA/LacB family sugar-phosphate isomerase [Fimbriimonadaceae bacterium]